MAVLRITQEQKLAAQRERKLLKCTKEQFMTAMKTAWEDGDSIDTYRQRLVSVRRYGAKLRMCSSHCVYTWAMRAQGKHTARLQNGLHVITELRPQLQAFHAKYKGSVDKVAALFSQLAPEPAKGKPLPPGMIHMLLRVPKDAKACSLEDLIECLQVPVLLRTPSRGVSVIACAQHTRAQHTHTHTLTHTHTHTHTHIRTHTHTHTHQTHRSHFATSFDKRLANFAK